MRITIEIPDNEVPFFKELLRRFNFVEVVQEDILDKKQEQFVKEVKDALQEVELHQAGKKKLKTAKQLLREL